MDSFRRTMTKSYVDGALAETTITAEKNLAVKLKSTYLWAQQVYFKHQRCDEFALHKANMPEMTLLYLNQGSLIYKNDLKMYYGDNFILG